MKYGSACGLVPPRALSSREFGLCEPHGATIPKWRQNYQSTVPGQRALLAAIRPDTLREILRGQRRPQDDKWCEQFRCDKQSEPGAIVPEAGKTNENTLQKALIW
jgi:hypothetical protein